jgi:hypothetical protein
VHVIGLVHVDRVSTPQQPNNHLGRAGCSWRRARAVGRSTSVVAVQSVAVACRADLYRRARLSPSWLLGATAAGRERRQRCKDMDAAAAAAAAGRPAVMQCRSRSDSQESGPIVMALQPVTYLEHLRPAAAARTVHQLRHVPPVLRQP